jgi:hypothetical protein
MTPEWQRHQPMWRRILKAAAWFGLIVAVIVIAMLLIYGQEVAP